MMKTAATFARNKDSHFTLQLLNGNVILTVEIGHNFDFKLIKINIGY